MQIFLGLISFRGHRIRQGVNNRTPSFRCLTPIGDILIFSLYHLTLHLGSVLVEYKPIWVTIVIEIFRCRNIAVLFAGGHPFHHRGDCVVLLLQGVRVDNGSLECEHVNSLMHFLIQESGTTESHISGSGKVY